MYDFLMVTIMASPKLKRNTILMGDQLASLLEIQPNEGLSLCAGQTSCKVIISISERLGNKKSIYLPPSILNKMHLRSGRRLGICKQDGCIRVGPVIGVMAETYNTPGRPFGAQSFFVKQIISLGRRMGQLCYGFSPYSVNWNRKVIYGYTFGKTGWVRSVFPLPDVIYPREKGYSAPTIRVRKRLEALGCKFINPILIGKWQTYKILSQKPELLPYIPETKFIKNFQQVDRMIRRHKAVYMKPVTGSRGKNIIKVVKNTGPYRYYYQMNNRLYQGTSSTIAGLRSSLRRVMGKNRYIIQKQINLIRSQGNVIDVRVMVQKDHSGTWSITGNVCRIGRRGSITSNIAAGGHASQLTKVLAHNFKNAETREKIENEIKMLALEVANTLESSIGSIGELGIDIGVDKAGRVWFIEANLKPGRQVFTLIKDPRGRRHSVEKPLLYCRYLAGFSKEGGADSIG
jgi:glutathione synthase/RimK-type ligase-like ATP-grasp enzyme